MTALATTLSLGWFTWQAFQTPAASAEPAPAAVTGTVEFRSEPAGAQIAIDGVERGSTPLRVSMPPGTYSAQITHGGIARNLPLSVQADSVVSHYVEFVAPPAAQGGRLDITSEPSGLPVRIAGQYRGITPLALEQVPAGTHTISVGLRESQVAREVKVTEGTTSTIFMSARPSTGATGGWLVVETPLEMEIAGPDGILGTTRSERLMLPVGTHQLTLGNQALEFTTTRTVAITAGQTAVVAIVPPTGRLSLNATPWAEVWINGEAKGVTPLGQLLVPVGSHEVIFRHPELGERRQTILVRAKTPTRVGVDLRK